jgi:hypothetical protein
MRSAIFRTILPETIILASFIAALPLSGAYAAADHTGSIDQPVPTTFQGPRVASIFDQIRGVDKGIADAEQAKKITPAKARSMERRADRIEAAAQRTAADDHGRIPPMQYRRLLHRVDGLTQSLKAGNGTALQVGNGGDG